MKPLITLLKELRESADIQYRIFTEGSCFRLYLIIKAIYPEAIPYWSDVDNHCITKVQDKFYDIGGEVDPNYIINNSYYAISKSQLKGYSLLKWEELGKNRTISVTRYK